MRHDHNALVLVQIYASNEQPHTIGKTLVVNPHVIQGTTQIDHPLQTTNEYLVLILTQSQIQMEDVSV